MPGHTYLEAVISRQVSEALGDYLQGEGDRAHFDRSGATEGRSVEEHARALKAARAAEVAEWDAWWGGLLTARPRRILDAGCGPGFCAQALGEHFSADEVVGLDIEPRAIDVVRALGADYPPLAGHVGRLEDLDLGRFDLIVCRTVLEHVDEPRRALAMLIEALVPGGSLFLETPNYLFPYEPHVGLWMLPKSPKAVLRMTCRATGRDPEFVDHLQFCCDPVTLSRWARGPEVDVHNLAADKVRRLGRGDDTATSAIGRRVLRIAERLGEPGRRSLEAMGRLPIMPSVQLLITRRA